MSLWFLSSVAWATGETYAGSWSRPLERSHFPSALLTWVFDQGFSLACLTTWHFLGTSVSLLMKFSSLLSYVYATVFCSMELQSSDSALA